ncbi:MAG: hypothetical protein LBK55_08815 [Azoarcus sp.]|jgi:hypothetical protein|nr:hypothetical protein [Azoarcus sp.]
MCLTRSRASRRLWCKPSSRASRRALDLLRYVTATDSKAVVAALKRIYQ